MHDFSFTLSHETAEFPVIREHLLIHRDVIRIRNNDLPCKGSHMFYCLPVVIISAPKFSRGEILQPLRIIGTTDAHGTKVTFKPDPEIFTDETVKNIANSVRQEIATKGYQTIENQAYEEWNSGHYDQALSLYQTCLNVKPQNPKVMYYMAMIYRAQGNTDQAVAMLTQVVTQYPDSSQAGAARTQLSAISPEAAQAAENPSAAAESSAAENPSAAAETQG